MNKTYDAIFRRAQCPMMWFLLSEMDKLSVFRGGASIIWRRHSCCSAFLHRSSSLSVLSFSIMNHSCFFQKCKTEAPSVHWRILRRQMIYYGNVMAFMDSMWLWFIYWETLVKLTYFSTVCKSLLTYWKWFLPKKFSSCKPCVYELSRSVRSVVPIRESRTINGSSKISESDRAWSNRHPMKVLHIEAVK